MRHIVWFLIYSSLLACSVPKVKVTEEYLFKEGGIVNGFTIHLIEVTEFNEQSYPIKYKETRQRADLIATGVSPVLDKIYFFKENDGYYWYYTDNVKHDILPFEFCTDRWYLIWSKDFDNSIESISVHFFIHKNERGIVSIYKEEVGKL